MSRTDALSRDALRLHRPILLAARISAWAALRRQRAALARLDSRALGDIGLSQSEARAEAARPFWDVPQSWRA